MTTKRKRSALATGDKILNSRYEILKCIHSAGMANVYLVQDSQLNKQWCLKEIRRSEAGKNDVEYRSILQEATVLKGLNHPNIPRITTIEEEGDSLFIVMDYVDGTSLKNYVMNNGIVPQDVAIQWMKQVTIIMSYLHTRKKPILYRDMKPDNIMIKSNGEACLLDFGISVVIKEEGQLIEESLGTTGYAPKEMRKGKVCDLRSDIYGMGRTFYFMLTGINPAQVPKDKKLRNVREIVPNISTGIERIITKCMQEEANNRYQSCEELLYDIENYGIYDTKYLKKAKRRIAVSFGLCGVSVALMVSSFIVNSMYETSQEDIYTNLVAVADQSGKSSDYEAVLDMRPNSKISIYNDYIESFKVDGTFTEEEEQHLLNYVNPNLETLKQEEDYGSLAYEIGKLYWFYYDGSADIDGMIASIKWFKDAKDNGFEVESADVYFQIGVFNRDILSSIAESNDSGMYREYWDNLIKAKEVNTGEIISLQVNLCIAKCIDTYMFNLKSDGLLEQELLAEEASLSNFADNFTPNSDISQRKYDTLVQSLEGMSKRISSLYKGESSGSKKKKKAEMEETTEGLNPEEGITEEEVSE